MKIRAITMIITMLVIILLADQAFASPFLVCDPQAGVEYYVVTGLPASIDGSHVAAQKDGSIKLDMATLPAGGPYSITAKACTGVWGCSVESPFVFSRPAPLIAPTNTRLAP